MRDEEGRGLLADGETVIRSARVADHQAVLAIYNHYVEATHVTFDVEPFSLEQRAGWFASFSTAGPHQLLVACSGDAVLGYACSKEFRPKPAYSTSVETSIYLQPEAVGGGVGRRLYEALLARLERLPELHRAFAGIALPNPASEALHARFGFEPVGTFREVGKKFGRFWDVAWYVRPL